MSMTACRALVLASRVLQASARDLCWRRTIERGHGHSRGGPTRAGRCSAWKPRRKRGRAGPERCVESALTATAQLPRDSNLPRRCPDPPGGERARDGVADRPAVVRNPYPLKSVSVYGHQVKQAGSRGVQRSLPPRYASDVLMRASLRAVGMTIHEPSNLCAANEDAIEVGRKLRSNKMTIDDSTK